MATIHIEEYRGYDIMFNTGSEKFQSDIDDGKDKNTLSSARKQVDEFIKSNQNFKPFRVFNPYNLAVDINTFGKREAIKTVTALRKDNAFQTDNKDQISNYDLNSKYGNKWFILKEENKERIFNELSILEAEKDKLLSKLKEIRTKSLELIEEIKGESLIDFRNRILN